MIRGVKIAGLVLLALLLTGVLALGLVLIPIVTRAINPLIRALKPGAAKAH